MSGDVCQHHNSINFKLAGYGGWCCLDCGGFKQRHTDAPEPARQPPKQAEADGAIHVEDARRALKQIDVLTQDVAALYDAASLDEKRLDALSKQGERHDRLLAALMPDEPPAQSDAYGTIHVDDLRRALNRIDALCKQFDMLEDTVTKLAVNLDVAALINSDATIRKRLDAFAEQGEAHSERIASLCEDVDMAKADTLRAHKFIDNLCELLSDMQRKTRGLP